MYIHMFHYWFSVFVLAQLRHFCTRSICVGSLAALLRFIIGSLAIIRMAPIDEVLLAIIIVDIVVQRTVCTLSHSQHSFRRFKGLFWKHD